MSEDSVHDERLSAGYAPQWDLDLAMGKEGEKHTLALLDGAEGGTVEVKNDARASETGNLYVEFMQRTRDGVWRDSGIRTTQASHWAYVLHNYTLTFVVPTDVLREYAETCRWVEMSRGSNPTRGFLVPIESLFAALREREVQRRSA